MYPSTDCPHDCYRPGDCDGSCTHPEPKALTDWSNLPKDIYVVAAKSRGDIAFDVACCSVPMVTAPEVRYTRADLITRGEDASVLRGKLDLALYGERRFREARANQPDWEKLWAEVSEENDRLRTLLTEAERFYPKHDADPNVNLIGKEIREIVG